MNKGNNLDNGISIPVSVFDIFLFILFLIILLFPSIFKLNRKVFLISFIIAIIIIKFLLTFYNVLYYNNSWYTQKYDYNKSHIYKEALNEVYNNTKNNLNYFRHYIHNSFTYNKIRDNTKYILYSTYNSIKYISSPIVQRIKSIFYGKP